MRHLVLSFAAPRYTQRLFHDQWRILGYNYQLNIYNEQTKRNALKELVSSKSHSAKQPNSNSWKGEVWDLPKLMSVFRFVLFVWTWNSLLSYMSDKRKGKHEWTTYTGYRITIRYCQCCGNAKSGLYASFEPSLHQLTSTYICLIEYFQFFMNMANTHVVGCSCN